ncbi:MAG: hypothetical protein IJY36_06530 [Coprobacter sp.]|nr:hypothetical protein [Coprobacter sp.]
MKNLFILVLIVLVLNPGYSQIKIQESYTNELIVIGTISAGAMAMNVLAGSNTEKLPNHSLYCRIFKDKTTYGILMETKNRFDDNFEFALGTSIDKAKESINTILEFMATKPLDTSIEVKDEDNRLVQITIDSRKSCRLKAIDANGAIIVDEVYLTKRNFNRALRLLDERAESKVNSAIRKNME